MLTVTHTHPFNSPLSGTTQVSQYRKGKTNPDFTEARDSEKKCHQLGHMQVCTSPQTDNHASTPPLSFLQAGCPSCHPTNSVKALKGLVLTVTRPKKQQNSGDTTRKSLTLALRHQQRLLSLHFAGNGASALVFYRMAFGLNLQFLSKRSMFCWDFILLDLTLFTHFKSYTSFFVNDIKQILYQYFKKIIQLPASAITVIGCCWRKWCVKHRTLAT